MPIFMGMFVSSTYLTKTCEVHIVVNCILVHICKIWGLYAHVACWLSNYLCNVVATLVKLYMSYNATMCTVTLGVEA